MSLQCPLCCSPKIASSQTSLRINASAGLLGGAVHVISQALTRNQIGLIAGALGGALGIVLGAAAGSVFGNQLGNLLDHRVLANNLCLDCGCRFNLCYSPA